MNIQPTSLLNSLGLGGMFPFGNPQMLAQAIPLSVCQRGHFCTSCREIEDKQKEILQHQLAEQAERDVAYRQRCQEYLTWFRQGYQKKESCDA